MRAAIDQAIAAHRAGDVAGARSILEQVLVNHPDDVTVLHMLGMIEAKAGRGDRARDALERAVRAAPDYEPAWISLARFLVQLGDHAALAAIERPAVAGPLGDEWLHLGAASRQAIGDLAGAAAKAEELAGRHPDDGQIGVAAARALAEAGMHDESERRYRSVLLRHPAHRDALLGLTGLAMSLNREDSLADVMAKAQAAGAGQDLLALGESLAARHAKDFGRALAAAGRAATALPPATYHQLVGELAERTGDYRRAADSFAAMNAADRDATPEADEGKRAYRADLADKLRHLKTPEPAAIEADTRPPPIFLIGFPRSGTTLLDTFLMGSSDLEVHEERGFLDAADATKGSPLVRRKAYWNALDAEAETPGRLQVDKQPLGGTRIESIHAMFPGAKYLFAMRHPCDVVWSCYATRFKLNWAMASFLTLEDAAICYDAVMRLWTEARTTFDLDVLEVRYEELIDDPEPLLRSIADFTGTGFDQVMIDHRKVARERGMIATASHAQVVEPLYARSNGRWRHYRDELEPVLPILEPWARHFGYPL